MLQQARFSKHSWTVMVVVHIEMHGVAAILLASAQQHNDASMEQAV
jgi:hypothetical protein